MSTATIKGIVLDVQTQKGTNDKGEWKRTTVVVETDSKYNNTVPVAFFNKDVGVVKGDEVEVSCYIAGREYQGKYYAQIDGNEISISGRGKASSSREEAFESESGDSGLPF